MDEESEVIAIFIDDSEANELSDEVDFSATSCLMRDATGSMKIKPTSASDARRLSRENSGVFRRSTPIVDPSSGEIIGYELESVESIRVAVG